MGHTYKWILSSKRCVKDMIFKEKKKLSVESLIYSWIIDLDDPDIENLFTENEWREIKNEVRELPKVDEYFARSLSRFRNVQTTADLRKVIETTSYRNKNDPFNRDKHFDSEWAELVMRHL
ncbi:11679_t:CDS:2 [Dentiscutata erythropus]|uniref:11679_t:CDS:1 n=1 Tax=Dentiscutata erythropus TaxID=1348616 RepID=A0A9N9NEI3_9GLOM|nr:11679_t:CDS:2 [Dentiscutata erythropus]